MIFIRRYKCGLGKGNGGAGFGENGRHQNAESLSMTGFPPYRILFTYYNIIFYPTFSNFNLTIRIY